MKVGTFSLFTPKRNPLLYSTFCCYKFSLIFFLLILSMLFSKILHSVLCMSVHLLNTHMMVRGARREMENNLGGLSEGRKVTFTEEKRGPD